MEMTEERTVLDAYLEMTGSSSNKGKKVRQIDEVKEQKRTEQ